ncbi:MAG: heme-binding protein [Nitrospirae bacterium]|jgi:hypothetical protein|nr:heme-binding protein [Nitrospirota bacterium]
MDKAKEAGRSIKRSFSMKLIFVAFMLLFSGEAAFAYEQPKYEIVKIYKGFELRRYAPYIVAETVVSGNFDDAGNKAFRILFKYISGNNLKKTEIPMTAPVNQTPVTEIGEKIEMTAPVEQTPHVKNSDTYVFSFIMPSKYTLETLPLPADPRVKLRQGKSRLLAARTYSGTWSEKLYRENEAALLEEVKAAGLTTVGEPIFARYNSPFTLWFLRKNEVLVEVKEDRDIQ